MINKHKHIQIQLQYYREQKDISQNKLAKKMQVTQSYISEIESGKKSPTINMIYRIADALEICPRLLLPCIINYEGNTNCNIERKSNESSNIQS